jgi:hypothetical protein
MQPIEWLASIERIQQELTEMHAYHQGYLERRAGRGITTATDTVMTRHQQTLVEAVDLLEALKATIATNEE